MQELALVSFFAQSPQPVFADEVVEGMCDAVLVRAGVPKRTVPFSEGLAEGSVRVKAKAILPLEKLGEAEVIGGWRLGWAQGLPDRIGGTESWHCCAVIDRHGHG